MTGSGLRRQGRRPSSSRPRSVPTTRVRRVNQVGPRDARSRAGASISRLGGREALGASPPQPPPPGLASPRASSTITAHRACALSAAATRFASSTAGRLRRDDRWSSLMPVPLSTGPPPRQGGFLRPPLPRCEQLPRYPTDLTDNRPGRSVSGRLRLQNRGAEAAHGRPSVAVKPTDAGTFL